MVLGRGREGQDLLLRGERQRVLLEAPQRLPVNPGHGLLLVVVAVQVGGDAEPVQGLGQEAPYRVDEADIGAAQGGVQLRYRYIDEITINIYTVQGDRGVQRL